MPFIKNVATGEVTQVTKIPVWVNGVWECGNLRFFDPSGTQFVNPAPGGVVPVTGFWLLFTVTEEVAIRAAAAGGMLAAGAAFTTASSDITMAAANPGWVIPGMAVVDRSLNGPSSGLYLGVVATYVGSTLTLAADTVTASLGTSDMLAFSGDNVLATWLGRLDDPRTLTVDLSLGGMSEGLTYGTNVGLLAAGRMAQILAGVQQ